MTCCKSNQWELTFDRKCHKCFERCHQILQELTVEDCPSCVNLEFGNGIFLNVTYPGWHVRELSQAWDLKMDICHLEKKWLKIGCSVLTCSFWFQKPSGHIKSNDLVITVIVWVGDFLELVQLTLNTPAWSQRRSLWRGPVWDKVMMLESWWDLFLPTLFQPFWSKSKNR